MTSVNSGRHVFSFIGGDLLTTIGATFFVSYLYSQYVDSTHENWRKIKTQNSRISALTRSESYHRDWLRQIENMSNSNLNRNTLDLDARVIKQMAMAVLENLPNA